MLNELELCEREEDLKEISKIRVNPDIKSYPQPCEGTSTCCNKEAQTCLTCAIDNQIFNYFDKKYNITQKLESEGGDVKKDN